MQSQRPSIFAPLNGLAVGAVVLFYACNSPTSSGGYTPNFINQNLQGQINGKPWVFAAGNVSPGIWDSSFSFNLVDTVTGADTCSLFPAGDFRKIMFSIHKHKPVLDTGTYALYFSFNGGEYQTVTFVYVENAGIPQNMIATEGAIRITGVDSLVNMRVTGMMDVKFDGRNLANGNFTLKYCP